MVGHTVDVALFLKAVHQQVPGGQRFRTSALQAQGRANFIILQQRTPVHAQVDLLAGQLLAASLARSGRAHAPFIALTANPSTPVGAALLALALRLAGYVRDWGIGNALRIRGCYLLQKVMRVGLGITTSVNQ